MVNFRAYEGLRSINAKIAEAGKSGSSDGAMKTGSDVIELEGA